jgi:uncharacterized membrane protein YfcA
VPGPDLELVTLILLIVAAFGAGWVDAVVGGGGLIQLPALLIALPPTTSPATILGTNKVSSVWGTATSSITYAVKIKPDRKTVLPLVIGSAVGSALGAQAASCCHGSTSHLSSCSPWWRWVSIPGAGHSSV